MADHPRHLQTAQRLRMVVVVAAVKVPVGLDDLAADDVPGDAWNRHGAAGGHGDDRLRHFRMHRTPHQYLHASEGAAGDRAQTRDTEVIEDDLLARDHVFDGGPWIPRSVR